MQNLYLAREIFQLTFMQRSNFTFEQEQDVETLKKKQFEKVLIENKLL